ncbi:Transport and Golgi organization protein 6, variant 2 [Balamuthia mandrillaris]
MEGARREDIKEVVEALRHYVEPLLPLFPSSPLPTASITGPTSGSDQQLPQPVPSWRSLLALLSPQEEEEEEEETAGVDVDESAAAERYAARGVALLDTLKRALCERRRKDREQQRPREEAGGAPSSSTTPSSLVPLLSVQEGSIISKALTIVSLLGIYPCFEPGVGVPLQRRSKHPERLSFIRSLPQLNVQKRYHQLATYVNAFVDFIDSNEELASFIVSYNLSDVLAGLAQLAHSPMFALLDSSVSSSASLTSRTFSPKDTPASIVDPFLLLQQQTQTETNDTSSSLQQERIAFGNTLLRLVDSYVLFFLIPIFFLLCFVLSLTISPKYFTKHSLSPAFVFESVSILLSTPTHPPPPWLSHSITALLSRCVQRPTGVRLVLEQVLCTSSSTSSTAMKANSYSKAVRVISSVPRQTSKERYYERVCPQVASLLVNVGGENEEVLNRAAVMLTAAFLRKQTNLTCRHLLAPVLRPLLLLLCSSVPSSSALSSTSASPSSTSVIAWPHLIFPAAETARMEFERFAEKAFSTDVCLVQEKGDKVVVKEKELQTCIESIHVLLRGADATLLTCISLVATTLFRLFIFLRNSPHALKLKTREIIVILLRLNERANTHAIAKALAFPETTHRVTTPHLEFAHGSEGVVLVLTDKREEDEFQDAATMAESLVELLKEVGNEELVGDLFVELLQHFVGITQALSSSSDVELNESQLSMLQLMAELSEQFGPALVRNVIQVCTMLSTLLQSNDPITVGISLAIMSRLLSDELKLNKEEEVLLLDMLPRLQELSNNAEDATIRQTASSLFLSIVTRDKHWSQPDEETKEEGEETTQQKSGEETMKQIFEELRDPLLPVRGHGLIALRRFLLSKHPLALQNKDKIFGVFQTQLQDEDSYVYLGAIQGLTALGDLFPRETVSLLVKFYIDPTFNETTRLKIGESLVLIAARCGEALPAYGIAYLRIVILSALLSHFSLLFSPFTFFKT